MPQQSAMQDMQDMHEANGGESSKSVSSLNSHTPKQSTLLAQAAALQAQQQALATTEALLSQPAAPSMSPGGSFRSAMVSVAGDSSSDRDHRGVQGAGEGSSKLLSFASGTITPQVERTPTASGTVSVFRAPTDTGGTGFQSANSSSFL